MIASTCTPPAIDMGDVADSLRLIDRPETAEDLARVLVAFIRLRGVAGAVRDVADGLLLNAEADADDADYEAIRGELERIRDDLPFTDY